MKVGVASNRISWGVTDYGMPHLSITIAMVTVVPDDEVFRVNLRPTEVLRFSGPCFLEILRCSRVMCDV